VSMLLAICARRIGAETTPLPLERRGPHTSTIIASPPPPRSPSIVAKAARDSTSGAADDVNPIPSGVADFKQDIALNRRRGGSSQPSTAPRICTP